MATKKKNLSYYLNLKWSYTVEQETYNRKMYYVIRVNELPGVCTDAETIEEGIEEIKEAIKAAIKLYLKQGDPIPEPIDKKKFKGNISYRTTAERHYLLSKIALQENKSLSKTLDSLLDRGIEEFGLARAESESRTRHR
ncbi:type II toxin-antitoxin system HicB family antitoxin [Candidatus Neptunochlamydia vexilliferae]|uniref:type II toxin-antitoxin system HicB family antitoxin n=1 Tax=Candidatus Neptunichlamydia vexilliferae TaxID=1651774 RepID=UPI001890B7B8|nr:type II toxin-antitoxin system HicB family antitoxin [Candidatus Neptunochlamydia vexilliferae]